METHKTSIFKNKTYNRLLGANIASKMGSYIGTTAFLFYLLKEFSEEPALATLNELLSTLPILLVFFLIGVVADKFDRQRIVYYSDILCAILSIFLLIAVIYGSLFFMFLFVGLRVMVHAFLSPAQSALVQGVLSPDEYMVASGINQMIASVMSLFGRGIGIFVFWAVGLTGAIIIDIASFIISAALICSCTIQKEIRLPNGEHSLKDLKLPALLKEYGQGVSYIFTNKPLLSLLSGYFVFGMLTSAYAILPVYILKYTLAPKTYETVAIWEGIVIGLGLMAGTYIITKNIKRLTPKKMISYGLLFIGMTTILISVTPTVPFFLLALFASALILPAINIGIGGIVPHIVDREKMGRVSGCILPLSIISQSLMFLLVAWTFPTVLSAEILLALTGGLMLLVAVFYLIVLPNQIGKRALT